jgi:hypothetical protein
MGLILAIEGRKEAIVIIGVEVLSVVARPFAG